MKRALTIMLALTMLIAMAACGSGAPAPTATPASTGSINTPAPIGTDAPEDTTPTEAPPSDGKEYGGRLRIITTVDTSLSFGLPWTTATTNPLLVVPFAEALCLESSYGEILPCLATEWETDPENSQIRMKIREGVKFHDGSDLNAEVVEWNFKMAQDSGFLNRAILGVEATGEYDITVHLDGYLNNALNILATHAFAIISKENYDKNGADYASEHPVGTGPFIFRERAHGINVVYERNDNYWQEGKPYLDEVEYINITDNMTQNAAMLSDAADVLNTTLGEQIATLSADDQLSVDLLPIGPAILAPSSVNEDSPLSKLEVRQAIAWAIDREAICEARGFGILTPSNQYIGDGYMGRLPDAEVADYMGYNPEKARELLTQAGYPDGFETTLIGGTSTDRDIAVALQSMLGEVGIVCELSFPEGALINEMTQNGWDGLLVSQARSMASITTTYRRFICPDYTYNVSVWRPSEEYRDLYVRSRTTPMMEDGLMRELSKLIMDYMLVIPMYDTYDAYVIRNNVHDTGFSRWGSGTLWLPQDAWISTN